MGSNRFLLLYHIRAQWTKADAQDLAEVAAAMMVRHSAFHPSGSNARGIESSTVLH